MHLIKEIQVAWDQVYETNQDNETTFVFLRRHSKYFENFKKLTIFECLLISIAIEKEVFLPCIDALKENQRLLDDGIVGETMKEVDKVLKSLNINNGKKGKNNGPKINPNFCDCIGLNDMKRDERNVNIIEKIEKMNNKIMRVEAFENIKSADLIAIHFEKNVY